VQQNRPHTPVYLWPEQPLVTPDREHTKDQRLCAVDNPSVTPFWPEAALANGTAVLIFPGGGYQRLSMNSEGKDIAHWFTERGVAAFVVKYRLHEYGYPAPILDGLRAVRLVRKHASGWNIDPTKIGVVGFSAGGHVAASIATRPEFSVGHDPLADVSAHADFAVLAYPVISMGGSDAHAGSRKALLGDNPSGSLVRENSLQYQVTDRIPPIFIQHGVGDEAVPITNSLAFFTEVQKYNKQSELHIYQSNIHGVGMIQGQGSVSSWPDALERWLQQNQWLQ
jgi:acetyl esterase/lipase